MAKHNLQVMDSDIHLQEPKDLWQRYTDKKYRDDAPKHVPVGDGTDRMHMVVAGRVVPPEQKDEARLSWAKRHIEDHRFDEDKARGWDSVSMVNAMNREGIDRSVVFPTMGLYAIATDAMSPQLALAISQAYNNWLSEFVSIDPKRLGGIAMVPPHDAELAAAEARRAVTKLGLKGVFVRPNPYHGRTWNDTYYDPLWQTLEELNAPVCFHEANAPDLPFAGDRFTSVFMQHIACHPMEQMMAMISFIAGGVLERHKQLRVAFLEGNCSWLPMLLWRMDGHAEYRGRYQAPYLKRKPSEYYAEGRCFVSVDCDESPAKLVVDSVGDESLVFSTDYPHSDSKYPHAVEEFFKIPMAEKSRRKILWDNTHRLYAWK